MELEKRYKNSDYLIFAMPCGESLTDEVMAKAQIKEIKLTARPGETAAFRVAVHALRRDIPDMDAAFTDLKKGAKRIAAGNISCVSCDNTFAVALGETRYVWVTVKAEGEAGVYEGSMRLMPAGGKSGAVKISLEIGKTPSDGDKYKYIPDLNSTLGIDGDITPPDEPVSYKDKVFTFGGRRGVMNRKGLPEGVDFKVYTSKGEVEPLGEKIQVAESSPAAVRVITRYGGDRFSFAVESKATYYGAMYFRLSVSSGQAAEITDAKVTLPESADTMLICGLSVSGNVIDLGGKVFDKGDEMTLSFALLPNPPRYRKAAAKGDLAEISFTKLDTSAPEYEVFRDMGDEIAEPDGVTVKPNTRYRSFIVEKGARLVKGGAKGLVVDDCDPETAMRLDKVIRRIDRSAVLVLAKKEDINAEIIPFFDEVNI